MLTRDEANALIDATPAGAVKLACLASLAARAEPELLRALRIDVARDIDAGAEADLWFSGLAGARSSSWLLLLPEVGEALRARRAEWFDPKQLHDARNVIKAAHAHASPLVQLEDELHWLSLGPDVPALDAKLRGIVDALRSAEGAAVARWAARTMPRLSSHVSDLPAAWLVRVIAEQQLGQPLRIDPAGGAVPAEVLPFLRGAMPMTELWARLVPGGLELCRDPLLGGHRFTAPLTEPLTVEVVLDERTASVPKEETAFVQLPRRELVVLRTLDGATHEISVTETTPRESVTFRWLMLADLARFDQKAAAQLLRTVPGPPPDAVFLARELTDDSPKHFAALQEWLLGTVVGREREHVPIFAVRSEKDGGGEWVSRHFMQFFDALPKPPRFRLKRETLDFSATIEHEGALIGVVGLGLREAFRMEHLEQACGMDPAVWAAAHHATILMAPSDPYVEKALDKARNLFSLYFLGGELLWPSLNRTAARLRSSPAVRGEIQIGQELTLKVRTPDREDSFSVPLLRPTLPRRMNQPGKWVLVAGGSTESWYVREVAREVGVALATAGYGLASGGWPGVDEEVTRGYASAIVGSPEVLQTSIHHYVGEVQPGAHVPGRRTFFASGNDAVAKSVGVAEVVVLIGGGPGTEQVGHAALNQSKWLLPIPATGGAAAYMARSTSGQWRELLQSHDRSPREHAQTILRAIADLRTQPPTHEPVRKKSPSKKSSSKKSRTTKRPMPKKK